MAVNDSRCATLRALVVEDHPFQRTGLVLLLRKLGVHEVGEAANGRAALEELARPGLPPVDLVLCDLDMPEMDGIEFLRAVAEKHLARGIVIISGREDEILGSAEAMATASGLRVLGQLHKPATLDGLRALIARLPQHETSVEQTLPVLDPALLAGALQRREIHVEFQPKVAIATGALMGVEALARWQPKGHRAIGPGIFVPIMVRNGLVTRLTETVLDAACRALTEWQAGGLVLDVAVNVSMSTLSDLSVADRLAAQVRAHGVMPSQIVFEVTETELMGDAPAVLNVLTRLRLKGFRLSIDDFGTGYSSLAQLNAIPFTELKIDRSFVRDCDRLPRLRGIVQSSVELARRLQIRTVAEGVETQGALDFLRTIGCDEAQGYYVAYPMSATDVPVWALEGRRSVRM